MALAPSLVAVWTLTAALALAMAAPAAAHARLEATDPAAGQTVSAPLTAIYLTYSEPIEESFSGVQVFDPAGTRVDSGTATVDGPNTTVPIEDMAVPGTYTVVFRVIGVDGHPVESRYTFTYQPDDPTEGAVDDPPTTPPTAAPTASASPTPTPSTASTDEPTDADATPAPTDDPPPPTTTDLANIQLQEAGRGTDTGLLVSRVVDYVALVVVFGGLVGAGWLYAGQPVSSPAPRLMRRAVALGGGMLAVSATAIFAFGLSSAAAEPLPQALTGAVAAEFAGTRFGTLVLTQGAIGLIVLAVALLIRGRSWLVIAAVAAAVAAVLPGMWGHAGSTDPIPVAVTSDWLHVVGAGVWVGGLGVLVLHVLRQPTIEAVEPVVRFSRLAGIAVWVVLASGVGSSLLHIGALDQLTETRYGRLVIVKVVLFAAIAVIGWHNRSRVIPRLRRHAETADGQAAGRTLRRFATAEIVLMVAALGVAGGLASTIPADAEAAARVEFVAAALTDEATVNVTIEPAKPGRNLMHIYILGPDGRPRPVDGARMELTYDDLRLDVDMIVSGPGHYTALGQEIPEAGEYLMAVTVDMDGATRQATAAVVIR